MDSLKPTKILSTFHQIIPDILKVLNPTYIASWHIYEIL